MPNLAFAMFAVIITFFAAAALDYADAKNKLAVQARDPHRAARWSIAMYLIGLIGFFGIIGYSFWLVIPECLGLYAGSWFALRKA